MVKRPTHAGGENRMGSRIFSKLILVGESGIRIRQEFRDTQE